MEFTNHSSGTTVLERKRGEKKHYGMLKCHIADGLFLYLTTLVMWGDDEV
jgi:hypothetical protein